MCKQQTSSKERNDIIWQYLSVTRINFTVTFPNRFLWSILFDSAIMMYSVYSILHMIWTISHFHGFVRFCPKYWSSLSRTNAYSFYIQRTHIIINFNSDNIGCKWRKIIYWKRDTKLGGIITCSSVKWRKFLVSDSVLNFETMISFSCVNNFDQIAKFNGISLCPNFSIL